MRPSVPLLRLALRLVRLGGAALPERERRIVDHAARLRLTAPERAAEAEVDALRRRLAASAETVEVVDFGAGTRRGARPPVRPVREVVRRAATGPAWGRFLFGLARAQRPRRVLELGTNLGLGAATLAAALRLTEGEGGPRGRLVTLEGAPALAALAAGHLAALGHTAGAGPDNRVRIEVGPFAETLGPVAEAEGPFDLVFVDGHHEEEAALAYLRALRPHLAPGALVVLDDVEPGRPVRRAWRRLRAERAGAPAAYAGRYGLLFPAPGGHLGGAPAALARETGPAPEPAAARPDGP